MLLQGAGRHGDADPAHAQQVRQSFVREAEGVRLESVARRQQPTGEACFHLMKVVAGGGLRDLGNQGMGIAVERALQGGAGFEGFAKV
jgi:hypothetical protein